MTLSLLRRTSFFAFSLVVILFSTQVYAQTNIAVVDVDAIMSQSLAAKSVKKQVEKKRDSFLSDVKKEEDKLRKEMKSLETQRAKMPKDEFIEKAKEFEKRRLDARNEIQKKKAKLDKSYSVAMNTILKAIFDVCEIIAKEEKIDLIITKQNIIVGSKSLNITDKVMKRMNKKLPDLKLK